MTRRAIKVAVADDSKDFAAILGEHLSQETDIELVGVAHDGGTDSEYYQRKGTGCLNT